MSNKSNVNNEIFLFNGSAPGSENIQLTEESFSEPEGDFVKNITQHVICPSVVPYIPENPNGLCIMIIPGGGFHRLVMSKEGSEIALWLNSLGVSAFILKHRMPLDGHKNGSLVPLQDAQRGLRTIRSLSDKYGYDKTKIGVMGFSAGGHVAATLGTSFDKIVYDKIDDIDNISARPNFLSLIYPVISYHSYERCGEEQPQHVITNHEIIKCFPNDKLISKNTPQTFLAVADDDKTTPSENSINFYLGLRKNNIQAEMHVFRFGGHGFGLGKIRGKVSMWTILYENWLETLIL